MPVAEQFSDTTPEDGVYYPDNVIQAFAAAGKKAAVIADPSGGATVDAESRTAINAIIDALQAAGIVASA